MPQEILTNLDWVADIPQAMTDLKARGHAARLRMRVAHKAEAEAQIPQMTNWPERLRQKVPAHHWELSKKEVEKQLEMPWEQLGEAIKEQADSKIKLAAIRAGLAEKDVLPTTTADIVSVDGGAPSGEKEPPFGNTMGATYAFTHRSSKGNTKQEAVGRVVLEPGIGFRGAIKAGNDTGEQSAVLFHLEWLDTEPEACPPGSSVIYSFDSGIGVLVAAGHWNGSQEPGLWGALLAAWTRAKKKGHHLFLHWQPSRNSKRSMLGVARDSFG